jgi:hypothetical protein
LAATKIDFDVNEVTGVFTITPYQLDVYIATNDTVKFNETKSRKFKIVFHGQSPLKEKKISHKKDKSGLDPGVKPGAYRYALAILHANGDELFLEPDCPSIIVH